MYNLNKRKNNFIRKANKTHKSKYQYDLVEYKNTHKKVKIICEEHGVFEQTPKNHLRGQRCSYCSNKILHPNEFIQKSKIIHKNKYDYSLCNYENNKTRMKIICEEHGVFEQLASSHLSGRGCKKCFVESTKDDNFIERSIEKHKGKYNYSLVDYKNNRTKVTIICPNHGIFEQLPLHHVRGSGCPSCAKHGFKYDKKALLYYVKIKNTNLYKIGITNNNLKNRFKSDFLNIDLIDSIYLMGQEAYNIEKVIKEKYSDFIYEGGNILKNGNTEVFTKDIINSNLKKYIKNEIY